ncbi:MAG TPA: heavy metal-associated domain-containing protein [Terriglobales bacterium]|nr:heavy metal-associated domain-containing protein [Terriglobales bacterium]
MRVSLKALPGVDTVDVSLEKGLATVKMKPGNTTTLKQLNQAVAKNGFTMKDSTAIVAGTVVTTNGKPALHVSGSNDVLDLVRQSNIAADAASFMGKPALVEGMIPESSKGKVPDTIRYQSITAEK